MTYSFDKFVQIFPEASLPLTLTEESAHEFGLENDPLSQRMIDENIIPYEEEEFDDMTEYIACCRLPQHKDYLALIYWRAALLNYKYVLHTYTNEGKLIDRRVIGGTFSDGKVITRSVAQIDEDGSIFIVTGQAEGSDEFYDASQSRTVELELLADGKILEMA